MLITAEQANIRQAPKKVRLVANQVKKLPLAQAISQLAVITRRSSLVLLKVLKGALSNALNNHHLTVEQLELTDIIVKDGPILKRMRAVSRGRGHSITKGTCHVKVILKTKTLTQPQSPPPPAANESTKTKTQIKEKN